ncbi:MAG: T9SS type A sorting domain-containing protein [Bacteroidia bacterium]|nr:T9SS type A sorting domain-containing protein [Bacteroidia bacterium]MDW8057111.1 T9SS type A sorting domain-containing protein [Bacteroidia bacterium]
MGWLVAQTPPLVTISQIQTPKNLAAGNDSSVLHGQYVRVRGVVATRCSSHRHFGVSGGPNSKRCSMWIFDTIPPYRGLQIRRQNVSDLPTGFTNLQPGQYVELKGTVGYFQGEIQLLIDTVDANNPVQILNIGVPLPPATEISLTDINQPNGTHNLQLGDQWQGHFVKVRNLTVTNVLTNPLRISVVDANGNQGLIFGEFKDLTNNYPVGTRLDSVKGIVLHYWPSQGTPMYEICPWHDSLMKVGNAVPGVSNLRRTPVCPPSSASVTVEVEVVGAGNDPITQVTLFWATGASTTYSPVLMTQVGTTSTYRATIPAQPQGTYVHYYVEARDQSGDVVKFPRFEPQSYRVNDAGCHITDIQYVIPSVLYAYNPTGRRDYLGSGYNRLSVSNVPGVVTATENDLGYIHIQQPGASEWAGIWVRPLSAAPPLQIGDSVVVTSALVDEYFGLTNLRDAQISRVGSASAPIMPIVLPLNLVYGDTQYAATEPYESMLVRFRHDNPSQKLRVVQHQISTSYPHQGDYRVGMDPADPLKGIRVLAGRQTQNIFSSLKVSYVNDSAWATTDGLIDPTLPLCEVYDSTTQMDSLQGIFTYQWNFIKLLPRSNSDFFRVSGTSCDRSTAIASASHLPLLIGPNPALHSLNIQVPAELGEVRLALYTLQGQCLAEKIQQGTQEWDLSMLPAGTYLLKVVAGSKQAFFRVVKL